MLVKQHKFILVVSLIYILLNHLTAQAEFSASYGLIIFLQKNSSQLFDGIFHLISAFGLGFFSLLPFLSILFDAQILRALRYIVWFTIGIGIQAILKASFGAPRPWWVYSDIVVKDCNADMGTPSGHSFISMTSCILLCYSYAANNRSNNRGISLSKSCAAFTFGLALMVGFSRIYLAAHSYDQVLLGFSFAVVYTAAIIELLEPLLEQRLMKIKTGEHVLTVRSTLIYAGTWLVLFFLPYFIYLARENLFENKTIWTQTVTQACGDKSAYGILFEATLYHSHWMYIGLTIIFILQLIVAYYVDEESEHRFSVNNLRNRKQLLIGVSGIMVCLLIMIPISLIENVLWKFISLNISTAMLGFFVVACHRPRQYFAAVPGKDGNVQYYNDQTPHSGTSPQLFELSAILNSNLERPAPFR